MIRFLLNLEVSVLTAIICMTISSLAYAQDNTPGKEHKGDSFTKYIMFNDEPSLIAYYVPETYDSLVPSKMVLGLHYCGGNGESDAITYRNLLKELADIINAVIVSPYCHNTGPPSYSIPDPSIITISIDSTRAFLNIDTSFIYLTGGSCNGRSTFKHGLDEIYPFRGIIPFNAYMPGITSGYYNFDSEMPSCICSGTLDPSYSNNVRMYDSLVAHGAVTYMNAIPGIGHVFNFPEFTEEMNECIEFIDSVALIPTSTSQHYYSVPELLIYPNPARSELYISAERFTIEEVTIYTLTGQQTMKLRQVVDAINISHLHKGMYIVEVMVEGKKVRRKLLIE